MNERDYVLAKQAGFVEYELEDYTESGNDIRFSSFADLIRADEREICADMCDQASKFPSLTPRNCANAIRARGNA